MEGDGDVIQVALELNDRADVFLRYWLSHQNECDPARHCVQQSYGRALKTVAAAIVPPSPVR